MEQRLSVLDSTRIVRAAYIGLCLSVIAHLGLYLIVHHSASVFALAGLITAFALISIGVTVLTDRLSADRIAGLRLRAARWRDLYLMVALILLWVFGLGVRPEWVYAHIAVMLCAGAILGYLFLYADAPPLSRWWWVVLGLAIIIVTLVRINALSDYPSRYLDDEPWDLGWALSYLQRGYFTDTVMYYGGFDIQRFMLPVAWWISIFGVGFWQTRLFFFLLIFPLTGLTGLAAHNFYGNGRITALVMLCSAVVMGAARIRHDVGLALAIAASLWLYSEALKRNKLRFHFLAGLAISLGWFAHYHAIGFGIVLTIALYLPDYLRSVRLGKWLPEKSLWLFILGGIVGVVLVFLFQLWPDWVGFTAVREPRTPHSLGDFVTTFMSDLNVLFAQSPFEFVLIFLAMAAALWRHKRTDVMLVVLVVLLHVALTIQSNLTLAYYLVPISPVYALLIASLLTEGIGVRIERSRAWIVASLIMIVNLGVTLQQPLVHLTSGAPLEPPTPLAAVWLEQHAKPTQTIVGDHWYYLFLTDHPFISFATQRYSPIPAIRNEPEAAMWDQIAPDFIVIDRNIPICCTGPLVSMDYLNSRGYQQVAEFPGDKYPVFVYAKDKPHD